MLNGNFLCLSCPSATFALQYGGFVPRDWLAAKDLLLFSLSSVMILLAFLSCSLFSFFFIKDQIASFQLKEILLFFN